MESNDTKPWKDEEDKHEEDKHEFSLEAGLKFIQQLQHRKKQTGIQTSSPSPLHSPHSLYTTYASIHLPLLPSFYSLPPLLTFSPPPPPPPPPFTHSDSIEGCCLYMSEYHLQ